MIIFRYLAREVLITTTVVTLILLMIFLSNQFVRFLMQIADGQMAYGILLNLMIFEVPFLLGYLLPIGFFFGLLLSYGRMYADSELTVMHACGIGRARLLSMTLAMALPILITVSILVFWVAPSMMAYQQKTMSVQGTQLLLNTIIPGRFKTVSGNQQVFYVQALSQDHKILKGVFAANYEHQQSLHESPSWVVYTAHSAYQMHDKQDKHFLIAKDGYRYAGIPGQKGYSVTHFGEMGTLLTPAGKTNDFREKALPTLEILQKRHQNIDYEAEWQWRWSMPFSIIVLSLLAIPLAKVNPRQGRYAKLLPAILLYIIYANMLFVARRWVDSEVIPASIGLWIVHGPTMLLALFLLAGERGRYQLARLFARRRGRS